MSYLIMYVTYVRVPLLYLIVPTYVRTCIYAVANALDGKVNCVVHTEGLKGLCVYVCARVCVCVCVCVCVFMCT